MKTFTLSLFSLLLLFSCTDNTGTGHSGLPESYIQGLATPIRLSYDSTMILLGDYFPETKGIESIDWNGQILGADSSGRLIITGQAPSPVSNLHIMYKGVAHDIPVFASDKLKHIFTYTSKNEKATSVEISGSMNGWNRKATPLQKQGDTWSTELILNSGLYQYRIWEDGKEMMDANNPDKIDNGMGAFNNTFYAGEKTGPLPQMISSGNQPGLVEITDLDQAKNILAYFENRKAEVIRNGNKIAVKIADNAKDMKRSFIRVYADNGKHRYNDILIPLDNGEVVADASKLERDDLQASVMYFAMVDRFVNGDHSNDHPTNDPDIHAKANNLGGDLVGIKQKIEDGYFKKLGISTIWISPISQNAEGAWGLWEKGVKSKFSAYHGYWPTALKVIDHRFGNEQQLKDLLDVAHKNGMNVILDYVAHHVHQDHPLYKEKPEWTTPLYLPDGTMNTEKWDEHRLTTWFDTFLPTWNFADHQVVEALTDSAMFWVENYDLDGFRHDATKHITEDFWRTLTHKVKDFKATHPGRSIYQVGETYGNPELISSYINSGELDAQFDFNLYDAAVDAFAKDNTSFENLERVMHESLKYYGSHHLMGNISGNQDRTRFISYADGSVQFSEDPKLAGWTRDIQNKDKSGFDKLMMLNAFLMTTPGIPCIYYGDEIGMPGANDPDNRRMMHFGDWNNSQQEVFDMTSELIQLRRHNMALTYGDLFVLSNEGNTFAYVRSYLGKNVIVVFNKVNAVSEPATEILLPEQFRIAQPKNLTENGIKYQENKIYIQPSSSSSTGQFQVFYE